MKILFDQKDGKKNSSHQDVKKLLENHAGYILISCLPPNEEGQMEVELSFDGDENLASYLIDSAQTYFEERLNASRNSS